MVKLLPFTKKPAAPAKPSITFEKPGVSITIAPPPVQK